MESEFEVSLSFYHTVISVPLDDGELSDNDKSLAELEENENDIYGEILVSFAFYAKFMNDIVCTKIRFMVVMDQFSSVFLFFSFSPPF